jgi:hypothetical protein
VTQRIQKKFKTARGPKKLPTPDINCALQAQEFRKHLQIVDFKKCSFSISVKDQHTCSPT